MKRNFLRKQKCKSSRGRSTPINVGAYGARDSEISSQRIREKQGAIKRWVILLVSNDLEFDKRLRMAAVQRGQLVIRVESLKSALRIVHTECAGGVLLDLDFAGKAAWDWAGGLMQDVNCPPVILITGSGEQFDLRMAVLAGSVLGKSADADLILNIVGGILEAPVAEHSITRRKIIGQRTPASEPIPLIPARRFWGINE
jgi:ActR/RegA family two-component response regulator